VPPVTDAAEVFTYLIVDGENIDATLGNSVLGGRRPNPEERPRWDRVRDFAQREWRQPVKGLFFLNATSGQLPSSFVQALLALDYRPIPLAGTSAEKVVDIGIQRTLEALEDRPGDVLLASHDGDFVPQVTRLLGDGRRVGVVGFREYVSMRLADLTENGMYLFDLEDDVRGFNDLLPRVRIIPIDDFDPLRYL
jgi:putative heme uptake system protein